MTNTNVVEVLEHIISEEQHPRLYKFSKDSPDRVMIVIRIFADHCSEGKTQSVIEKLEKSEPVEIMGRLVEPFVYPAIYCWYRTNPGSFLKFFKDSVTKMWNGNIDKALKMLEEYFERGFR